MFQHADLPDTRAGKYRLRLHYFPQLVLHNPNSVRLSLTGYQFQRNIGAFSTAGSYNTDFSKTTKTAIQIVATPVTGTATTLPHFLVNQASNGRFTLRTRAGDCDSLEPGETRVFALEKDNDQFANPAAAITFGDLASNPSTTADWSQQCDVLSAVDANGNSTGAPFETDGSTSIRVNIVAATMRLQNVDTFILPSNANWPQSTTSRLSAGGASSLAAAAGSWTTLRIDQLSTPRRVIGFFIRQKGLKPSSSAITYSNAANAVPIFMGNYTALSPVDDNASYIWREIYMSPFGGLYTNSASDLNAVPNDRFFQTSFGDESTGAAGMPPRYVLRDVPNQPMVSLGQFMHMSATRYLNATGDYAAFGTGSLFVGGSYASPAIPTEYNALAQIQGSATGGAVARTIYCDDHGCPVKG